jgi:hypothetical protein
MNCQEFERTIIDLRSEHLIGALEHAETCARCHPLLKREQRMTAGLQALAAEEATINAPERVRSALRAVFDEQHTTVAERPVSSWSSRPKLIWGMAAAAMLMLTAVTAALLLREPRAGIDDTMVAEANKTTPVQARQRVSAAAPPEIRAAKAAKPYRGSIRRPKPELRDSADDAGALFPLTYVARSGPTEFVQKVRVEISRSTLLSMGVPVNLERGEGLIKAEITIGEDGVARAVRIIN